MPSTPRSKIPLTLVVAMTPSLGIGKNGGLPWPQLKEEMAYFARVTKRRLPVASERNAVIMGRKTWESIPERLRPLKDRINVVVSSATTASVGAAADGPLVVSSLTQALDRLTSLRDERGLGRVFVIGGAQLYDAALRMDSEDGVQGRYLLLTKVWREYDCDTTFPIDVDGHGSRWVRRPNSGEGGLGEFVGENVPAGRVKVVVNQGEEGAEEIEFEHCLYSSA